MVSSAGQLLRKGDRDAAMAIASCACNSMKANTSGELLHRHYQTQPRVKQASRGKATEFAASRLMAFE
jgi:hypothetical protein